MEFSQRAAPLTPHVAPRPARCAGTRREHRLSTVVADRWESQRKTHGKMAKSLGKSRFFNHQTW